LPFLSQIQSLHGLQPDIGLKIYQKAKKKGVLFTGNTFLMLLKSFPELKELRHQNSYLCITSHTILSKPRLAKLNNYAQEILTSLSLRGVKICDDQILSITKLTALKILDLSFTPTTDQAVAHLSRALRVVPTSDDLSTSLTTGLGQLERLNLEMTLITEKSLRYFQAFPNLIEVDVSWTRITKAQVDLALKSLLNQGWLLSPTISSRQKMQKSDSKVTSISNMIQDYIQSYDHINDLYLWFVNDHYNEQELPKYEINFDQKFEYFVTRHQSLIVPNHLLLKPRLQINRSSSTPSKITRLSGPVLKTTKRLLITLKEAKESQILDLRQENSTYQKRNSLMSQLLRRNLPK
jgi:hypothetical protein